MGRPHSTEPMPEVWRLTHIYDLGGIVLVRCPRCDGQALLRDLYDGGKRWGGYRLSCERCAHTRDWPKAGGQPIPCDGPHLSGFDLDLWLQTLCCGHTLWAFNTEHIRVMEEYIGASVRDRSRDAAGHCRNNALISRLPKWMISARNREAVLKGLARLRDRLAETE